METKIKLLRTIIINMNQKCIDIEEKEIMEKFSVKKFFSFSVK